MTDPRDAEIRALQQQLQAKAFASYEVVRCAEPVDGKPARFHVYGITFDGVRVSLDYLYLRDHDTAYRNLLAENVRLRAELERAAEALRKASEVKR